MNGYLKQRDFDRVIEIFNKSSEIGIPHDTVSYLCVLKACAATRNKEQIDIIHHDLGIGRKSDTKVCNSMINGYGKCGDTLSALQVFEAMKWKKIEDIASYNCIMTAYSDNAQWHRVLEMYKELKRSCFVVAKQQGIIQMDGPIPVILALKAAAKLKSLEMTESINRDVKASKFGDHSIVQNCLITAYGSCGALGMESAETIFKSIPDDKKTVELYNNLMTVHLQRNDPNAVIRVYRSIEVGKSGQSVVIGLQAAGILKDIDTVQEIEGDIVRFNGEENVDHIQVINTLISAYGHCGDWKRAQKIFDDQMKSANYRLDTVVSMMSTYFESGLHRECLEVYHSQKNEVDVHPKRRNMEMNAVPCFIVALSSSKALKSLDDTMTIHRDIDSHFGRRGVEVPHSVITALMGSYAVEGEVGVVQSLYDSIPAEERSTVTQTALLSAYSMNGDVKRAKGIYDEMATKNGIDLIAHNAMLSALEEHGLYQEAIDLYTEIVEKGNIEEDFTLVLHILSVCIKGEYLDLGMRIHREMKAEYRRNPQIISMIIHLYGKRGDVNECFKIWKGISKEMKGRDVSVWNAMIGAFGVNGRVEDALTTFGEMRDEFGLIGNEASYCAVINACSHSGYVKEAKQIFKESISNGLVSKRIVTALVDCYSRKGKVRRAAKLINNYEEQTQTDDHHYEMWMALFAGCIKCGDDRLGNRVRRVLESRFHINMDQHQHQYKDRSSQE